MGRGGEDAARCVVCEERRQQRSNPLYSSAASDVDKRRVEAPKRVTSAAPDAADARFKAVLKAARIQRLLLLLSLSLL